MHPIITIIVSLLLASAAHGGPVTAVVKIAGKVASRSADNVAEKVVIHNTDDAAKIMAKGVGTTATHAAPAVERTVARSVELARAEAAATRPVVQAAPRTPILRPGNIAATGLGVAAVDAAHNLTSGTRDKDRAIADSTRKTIADHPDLLADVVRADAETGFWNKLGTGIGRGFVWLAALVGSGYGLAALIRAIPARRRRKPAVAEASPDAA